MLKLVITNLKFKVGGLSMKILVFGAGVLGCNC